MPTRPSARATQPPIHSHDLPILAPPRTVNIRPVASWALGLWLLGGLSLSGCYSGYYLTRAAPDAAVVHEGGDPRKNDGFPVYLASVTANPPGEAAHTQYALARKLETAGRYSGVYLLSPPGRVIEARLKVDTSPQEDQEAWNLGKMVLSGLTAFLLTPALPQTLDYDSVYTLRVTWPNAQTSRYTAACGAHSYATLDKYRDVQNLARALNESSCLNSLVNQMSADYPRMAGNAVYTPPNGTTTSQLEKNSPSRNQDSPTPGDVCQVLGYRPGSKTYTDCLVGVD